MQYLIKLIMSACVLFCAGALAAGNDNVSADQQFAKLPLPQQLWFKLEAKREAANNNISKESAIKAIQSADAGLNLANIPIDMAIYFVMWNISKDADNDIRDVLNEAEQLSKKKKDQRDELAKQKAESSVALGAIRVGAVQNVHPKLVRSTALNEALVSKKLNFDSLSSLNGDQQLKLQTAVERREKAEEALSNTLKKISNTQSSIVGNMK